MNKLFVLLLLLTFCSGQQTTPKEKQIEQLVDLIVQNPTSQYVEFPDLYAASTTIIAEDSTERLILVQLLKRKGFEITNSGRGNHPLGPRIVSLEMKSKDCECLVDKIYYQSPSESEYVMTERIKCKSIQ